MPKPTSLLRSSNAVIAVFFTLASACAGQSAPPQPQPSAQHPPSAGPADAVSGGGDAPAPEDGRNAGEGPAPPPEPDRTEAGSHGAPPACSQDIQNKRVAIRHLVELACRGRFQVEAVVVQKIPCPKCPPGPALCDQACMKDRVQVADEPAATEGERLVMDLQVEAGVLDQLREGSRYVLSVDSLNGYMGNLVRVDPRP